MSDVKNVLKALETKISVTNSEEFDPKEYYQNREGLYVWSSFNSRILAKTSPVEKGKEFSLASFNLIENASDEEIEAGLPEQHLFDESDACAVIAGMIAKQPKGEEGDLLNTGYANLFYTPSFVVSVHWGGGRWRVDSWGRDGDDWSADGRVFSPAIV